MTALPALLLVLALTVTSAPTEANAGASRTMTPAAGNPAPVSPPARPAARATAERPVPGSAKGSVKGSTKTAGKTPNKGLATTRPKPLPKALPPPVDVSRMTPRERRCYGRINQPAASVLLNRTLAPRAICVQSCEAKLIAPRRESGRIAALTLYTGRACRLPPGYKERPATEIASARPTPSAPRKR